MKRNVGTIVLYAPFRNVDTPLPVYPPERSLEIDSCKNDRVRREKYLVWKLLEHAVKQHLKLDFDNLRFTKNENGKWICPDFNFSLSHTDGAVCVAVSDAPVGVDIERVREIRTGLSDRILTERERSRFDSVPYEDRAGFLIEAWVKKESIFKRSGGKALMPSRIESFDSSAAVRRVIINNEEYLISVACGGGSITIQYTEEI